MIRNVRNVFFILGYTGGILKKSSLSLTIVLFLLSTVGGLMTLVELWAMTAFIDEITGYSFEGATYLEVFRHFIPYIGAFVGAMLFQRYVNAIQPYLSARLNEKTGVYLQNKLFQKSMKLKLEVFESESYYDRFNRARKVIQGRIVLALEDLGAFIHSAIQFIVIVYAVWQIGAVYGVLLVLSCIPIIYFNVKSSKHFVDVNYGQSLARRKQSYWRNTATKREAAAEVRLFQLGSFIIEKWQAYTKELITEILQARRKMAVMNLKGRGAYLLLLFLMMGATVWAGVQGTVTLGVMVATLYLLDRLEGIVNYSGQTLDELTRFYFQIQEVPQFLMMDEVERDSGVNTPDELKQGIRFEQVSFTYPGKEEPALEHVSFTIRPGESIALVGENGGGKSTLCLLLLGLYQPTSGKIYVDDVELTALDPATWRKKAAVVFQNYMRYQLSARENIAFGNTEQLTELKKVKLAASKSGIHPTIEEMSLQYETLLGKQYEKSRDLSGGEWQKVALARAYFREAELLILDEPASALDAHAEYEVYKKFQEVSQGKTVVIVSHRLGSARLADRILFLKNGRLIESGSHDQLLGEDGEYASLFQMQASWYAEKRGDQAHEAK